MFVNYVFSEMVYFNTINYRVMLIFQVYRETKSDKIVSFSIFL